jgi:hypothetical protein
MTQTRRQEGEGRRGTRRQRSRPIDASDTPISTPSRPVITSGILLKHNNRVRYDPADSPSVINGSSEVIASYSMSTGEKHAVDLFASIGTEDSNSI